MADSALTGLTELNATPADGDLLYVVDVSDTTDGVNGTNKKITRANAVGGLSATGHTHLLATGATDVTSSAAELNIMDGVTATTAEINKLAGIPAGLTATELGYVDGVTSAIQTQLDAKQASGATLTSLEGLSLVAGDILYATGADTLARLPKGTASQEIRMNAGATAPEWYTPSAGGSAYIPKFRVEMAMGKTDTAANGGAGVSSFSGANALFAYLSGSGVRLTPGSTTTGLSRYLWRDQITHEYSTNLSGAFWNRGMWGGVAIQSATLATAAVYGDVFFGFGDVQSGVTALPTAKHAGIWIESRNGVIKYYISTYNGSTHTKTEITSSVTAITNPPNYGNAQYSNLWGLEWTPATSFKIYCDGTLVGTLSSNLPSGSMLNDYIGGGMFDTTTSHTYNSPSVVMNHGFMEVSLW